MILELSEDDLVRIAKAAKERKFSQDKKIIYNENNEELTNNFLKSYEFLKNLEINLPDTEKKIKEKIKQYLLQYKGIFLELHKLNNSLERKQNFGKSRTWRKINHLVNLNKEKLIEFINVTFPIGRVISFYDPEEAVGYQ